jgi:hypothetical protein
MDESTKLWEQQNGEPNESYSRFLIYRNMGALRSVDKAYQNVLPNAKRANGQWRDDCAKFEWVSRASAWDIYTLTEIGQRVVVRYVNALDLAFQRIIESLSDTSHKPKSWDAIIESITILGGFIPQETVATIRQNNAGDTVPAIGRGADKPSDTTTA